MHSVSTVTKRKKVFNKNKNEYVTTDNKKKNVY